MGFSGRTIALIAGTFDGGAGPSHTTVEEIWVLADAADYLPDEGSKHRRVLHGLRNLQRGRKSSPGSPALSPNESKLLTVVEELSVLLLSRDEIDPDELDNALQKDGYSLADGSLEPAAPGNEPADRIESHVLDLFGKNPDFHIAKKHYEQASQNFALQNWEAANAQFRSAFDAAYDALASTHGCPSGRSGGRSRKWLADNGYLDEDESQLLQSFASFAGAKGSHAGLSASADSQLRRHFSTALIAFGIAKLG